MDLAFAKDQEMIRSSAREFFEKECPKEKTRELKDDPKGYDPKMWKKMAKLGFMGLVIPEEYKGTEGEYFDLLIFMEEMGRNIVPCPFFTTVALCAAPILEFGTDEQKKNILPKIADKGHIWSLALTELESNYEPSDIQLTATADGSDYLLNGTKLFVPYANVCKYMLVAARTGNNENSEEGITMFMVDAKSEGIEVEVIPTTARDMRCEVRFKDVKVSSDSMLGEQNKGWDVVEYIIQYASPLKAAEMLGGTQAVLEIATKYARERVQFGKPLGAFQVIQHRLVNLLTEIDGLKYLVYEAGWKIDIGEPSKQLTSMAKAKANKVYHRVCFDGIVIHGAIGWTEEMDISLYHLRTKSLEFDLGGTDFHRERIASELEKHKPDFLSMWA